jgi:pre-mRNA-splicing factor 18
MSIGNAAWPIGVTAVGIHERAGRDKLSGGASVAHVLNDEVSRRWIQSIKRYTNPFFLFIGLLPFVKL